MRRVIFIWVTAVFISLSGAFQTGSWASNFDAALAMRNADAASAMSDKDNYSKAIRLFEAIANEGSIAAAGSLGLIYYEKIKPRDYARALKWFKHAIKMGDSVKFDYTSPFHAGERISYQQSLRYMGDAFRDGKGVPKNINEWIKWYKRAAKAGPFASPASYLAEWYHEGTLYGSEDKNTALNYKEAAKWYAHLASMGSTVVLHKLGEIYFYGGHGVKIDYKEAFRWLNSAAREKSFRHRVYNHAQANLGWLYQEGKGVAKDLSKAREWHKIAAGHGNAFAQANLGWLYQEGQGVVQDYKEAVKWYRKSAEQGNAFAQSSLGYMYDTGQGVVVDFVRAHMWYNLADSNGYKSGSKNRDLIAKEMNPSQIAEAKKLARECIRKQYRGC